MAKKKTETAPSKATAPAGTRRTFNITGLITIEVAPGVFFSTNQPTASVRFSWDTGSSSGSWTNIT